jgi:anti-sigma factor RsiW
MDCPEARALLQAAADGELGPADTLRLDAHLAGCPTCAAQLASIRALRTFIAQAAPYHRAPAGLHARVLHALPSVHLASDTGAPSSGSGPGRRLAGLLDWFDWGPRVNAGMATLTVAALGIALLQFASRESPAQGFERELVSSHVRALVSGHGIDVVSSDRHTVKPWFNGRLDYAPDVPDLAAQGFPLVGGRLDYLDGRRVAVLVYRRPARVRRGLARSGGGHHPIVAVERHRDRAHTNP